jgi:hypothetical protein
LVLLFVKMDFTHNNETPKTNDPHIEQTHTWTYNRNKIPKQP